MSMVIVNELEKTCDACPSQWEGKTIDGRHVYVRYRWGWLQVGFGPSLDAAVDDDTIGKQLGDSFDGFLDLDGLKAATSGEVSWPA
jgi:hypothetical protein